MTKKKIEEKLVMGFKLMKSMELTSTMGKTTLMGLKNRW